MSRVSGRSKSVYSSASAMAEKRQRERIVFHVDPQAALIPTEEQWNEIVENNLKSYQEQN